MKPATKQTRDTKTLTLNDHPGYAEACAAVQRAEDNLNRFRGVLQKLELKAVRLDRSTKLQLSRDTRGLPQMDDREIDRLALRAAEYDIETPAIEILAKLELLDRCPVIALTEERDSEDVQQIVRFRAVTALFEAAVRRLTALRVVQRKLAASSVLMSIRRERANVLKSIGLALTQLAHALSVENSMMEELRRQDESLLALLDPPPFPLDVQQIAAWLQLINFAPPAPGDPLISESAVQVQ